ncbi:TIM-barrel domain-containing protein [Pelagicoccus sp. SDUM812005]|uniref:glycoside hydrolase family 31 protein n=1 Tax=Pelagicoccus sp. SDUM812005 TaxID=3041257 RepID=UPI00280DC4DC|nr:TIM-barrel domain-containing protein [Pelagicoccus sp. SDUM812005]MDQ8179377.1 glycoside hydrolase family 31 protein [Pelagicoccus sp. SDUM812005]
MNAQPFKSRLESGYWIQIDFPTAQTARVRVNPSGNFPSTASGILVNPEYQSCNYKKSQQSGIQELSTGSLRLRLDSRDGQIHFFDEKGELRLQTSEQPFRLQPSKVYRTIMDEDSLVLTETVDGERAMGKVKETIFDRDAYSGEIRFQLDANEALYGLGSHEESHLNLRGTHQYLYQHNLKACVPTLVSTKSYGLLFHAECAMEFDDRSDNCTLSLDTVEELDFFFYLGDTPDAVIAQYRILTGRASMMPRWAFGYWQSKERYKTQEEIVSVAREFRNRQIPIDLIVQDWHYWPDGWGGKHFDATRYPDPAKLCSDIHDLDMKVMISIWPNMMDSKNRPEMIAAGKMLNDHTIYNAFDPEARELYWKQAEEGIFQYGFDAWWCDSTEPYIADWEGDQKRDRHQRAALNIAEFKRHIDPAHINAYSLYHSQGIYENQLKSQPNKRVVNLTRSAYAGQQRFGTITWPGDPSANWETLRQNIAALLNFSASGCPWVTMDIGAFFVKSQEQWFWSGDYPEGVDDLGYRELYTRWLQFGAFTPVFRSHGTDTPREPWRFGEPGTPFYDSILKFINLRYRLLPYIYSAAAACHRKHDTLMRPLAFDFSEDEETYSIADQVMFGPSIMACPVTEPMYYRSGSAPVEETTRTRRIYLPAGTDWYDFWTGERFNGGQTIAVDTPIDTIPLFVKAGSIIPIGPELQHTGESPRNEVSILLYPGADTTFDLYQDDGETYAYEEGDFELTELSWDEALQTLSSEPNDKRFSIILGEEGFPL